MSQDKLNIDYELKYLRTDLENIRKQAELILWSHGGINAALDCIVNHLKKAGVKISNNDNC